VLTAIAIAIGVTLGVLSSSSNEDSTVPKFMNTQLDQCMLDMDPECLFGAKAKDWGAAIPSPPAPPPPPPPLALDGSVQRCLSVTVDDDELVAHKHHHGHGDAADEREEEFETNGWQALAGSKPYFHSWHGASSWKSFFHDATANKGEVSAIYRPSVPERGCYLVQEWHPFGSGSCGKYQPKAVPLTVRHEGGVTELRVDQSVFGGRWNSVGKFVFEAGGGAEIVLSNNGTDDCDLAEFGLCYWVADAIRLVHLGESCDASEPLDSPHALQTLQVCDASFNEEAERHVRVPIAHHHIDHRPSAPYESYNPSRFLELHQLHEPPYTYGVHTVGWQAYNMPSSIGMNLYMVHGHEPLVAWGTFTREYLPDGNWSAHFLFPSLQCVVENCRTCEPGGAHFQLQLKQVSESTDVNQPIETHGDPFDMRWIPGGQATIEAWIEQQQAKKGGHYH